jgi:hypothetical protein
MDEHLGYEKHDVSGRGSGNSRNGTHTKTVLTEIAPVEIDVPRDTGATCDPQIVKRRQRRLTVFDEIVLSMSERALNRGNAALRRRVRCQGLRGHHLASPRRSSGRGHAVRDLQGQVCFAHAIPFQIIETAAVRTWRCFF